jgi:plasmid stabilization system protein ParE
MALTIEFSRRSTNQLKKILTYYDERNGSDTYSRRLLRCLLQDLQHLSQTPTASSPSTRSDVRFFYLMGFTIIFRYSTCKLTVLSIRSSARKPLKIYQKQ